MRCTVIGCWGGSCPKNEACSGYLLEQNGFYLLLDCGSGVLSVLQNVLELKDLHHILLSHFHFDHYSDAGSALYARLIETRLHVTDQPLQFWGPEHPKLNELCWPPYSEITVIDEHRELQIGPFRCTFMKTRHPLPCMAMRIESAGSTLVYTADSAYFQGLAGFCRGADLLISECSLYAPHDGGPAGHLNAEQVGKLAAEAGVRQLMFSHLPLYGDLNELYQQIRRHYSGTLIQARRLLQIDLTGG